MFLGNTIQFLALFLSPVTVEARGAFQRAEMAQQQIQARRLELAGNPKGLAERGQSQSQSHSRAATTSPHMYLNNVSRKFVVNGTGIPDVPFDIGESYAGLLPISNASNETAELFFWFFPSEAQEASDEIVIWLNGGPGCSSLSGLLTENGPFLFQAGTLAPVPNTYAWSKVTNMVWIEQPVGTGYDQGAPSITNEVELAQQFKGFWKNFVDTFGLQNRKVYLTGESYAGYYCSYIADTFMDEQNPVYFDVKGVAINDPEIGDDNLQGTMPALAFVEYWSNLFYLNQSFLEHATAVNEKCGIAEYNDKYFRFPPPAQPWEPYSDAINTVDCAIYPLLVTAIAEINPCFNPYYITDTCPYPYSHLGPINPGGYQPPGAVVYFDRPDVRKAINAPANSSTWHQCARVFPKGDDSPGPALDGTLARVIEKTNNTIIGSGNLDFILPTNGTLFALQNVTWNGGQGFAQYPSQNSFIVPSHAEPNAGAKAGAGTVGSYGTERGLTFYQVQLAGHEVPAYAAGAGLRSLQFLLGRIKSSDDSLTPLV